LQEVEKRIERIKTTCEAIVKKVSGCLQQGPGKDAGPGKEDKRMVRYVCALLFIFIICYTTGTKAAFKSFYRGKYQNSFWAPLW